MNEHGCVPVSLKAALNRVSIFGIVNVVIVRPFCIMH